MITIARERERIPKKRKLFLIYIRTEWKPNLHTYNTNSHEILCVLMILPEKGRALQGNSRTSFDAFEIYVNPYEREIREIKKGIKERQIQREISNGWWCTSILSSISAKPLWMLISRPDLFHSFKQKCFFYFPFTVFISLDKEGISIVEGSLRFI